jgi:hypothetical protein
VPGSSPVLYTGRSVSKKEAIAVPQPSGVEAMMANDDASGGRSHQLGPAS